MAGHGFTLAHTATHVIHWTLKHLLGDHARQAGSLVQPGRLRFDFPHHAAVPADVLAQAEDLANERLAENGVVTIYETTFDEAKNQGATALFGEKYGEFVRVVEIGEFSKELCGGTHVARAGNVALIRILGEGSIGAGMRRVEALVGPEALHHLRDERALLDELVAAVGGGDPRTAPERVRALAERGHDVVVLEAAAKAGGQILLTAQSPMRREMMAIVDWRLAQCEARGVTFHYNTLAEAHTVTALKPDIVVIATGGLPHTGSLKSGADLVTTSWDILSADVKPGTNVLMYDEAGDHSALQSAEIIAETGAKLEIMTRDRSFAPEVMAMSLTPHMRALQKRDVKFTVTYMLESVRREGNQLVVEREVDRQYALARDVAALKQDRNAIQSQLAALQAEVRSLLTTGRGFLELAAADPDRWLVLDATRPEMQITHAAWERIRVLLSA